MPPIEQLPIHTIRKFVNRIWMTVGALIEDSQFVHTRVSLKNPV
jgi:hypothetical protein